MTNRNQHGTGSGTHNALGDATDLAGSRTDNDQAGLEPLCEPEDLGVRRARFQVDLNIMPLAQHTRELLVNRRFDHLTDLLEMLAIHLAKLRKQGTMSVEFG